ncbi:MAG: hypothetical protein KC516_04040 [Nanoarchaeota archaeon]|nr:hypothetical protein [Nanoarchaeota archaeon]
MGVIRGAGVVIASALLFLSLFLAASFLNLSWSLEYDTFEPAAVNYSFNLINKTGVYQELLKLEPQIEFACQTEYNYLFVGEDGLNLDFVCSTLDSGFDAFITKGLEDFVYKVYYDDYDCEFLTCLKESKYPLVLISEKAKDYWYSKYKNMLLASIVLFALLFLFVKKKYDALIIAGILMIVSSFLFRKLDLLFSFIPELTVVDAVNLFFARSYLVYTLFLIIGILLLVVGLIFRFFHTGLKIFNWFKKKEKPLNKEDVKAAVKEEIEFEKKEKISSNIKITPKTEPSSSKKANAFIKKVPGKKRKKKK